MEFGELDLGVLNELKDLDFSNCNQTPPAMPMLKSVDRRHFNSWTPSTGPSVGSSGPNSNQRRYGQPRACHPLGQRFVEIAPRHSRYNKQMEEMLSMSESPVPCHVSLHPLGMQLPRMDGCHSCPPVPQKAEQKEAPAQHVEGILFESRYLKARCDALEKERAVSNRQAEVEQGRWRQRESVLLGQVKAKQAEIMDLRHRLHRMRSFMGKLPNSVRRQFHRNDNEPGSNDAMDRRGHYGKDDVADMPQRAKLKSNNRRNHKHRKRNNKNNNWRSTETHENFV